MDARIPEMGCWVFAFIGPFVSMGRFYSKIFAVSTIITGGSWGSVFVRAFIDGHCRGPLLRLIDPQGGGK